MTAIHYVDFMFPYLFLTDDEQSKAIAQISQVRHEVHQNQELRPREREMQRNSCRESA